LTTGFIEESTIGEGCSMRAIARPPFPYEDSRTWNALRTALTELQRIGAVRLVEGERPVLSALCASLDRAGVFSLGEDAHSTSGA
jgi:hypothetical protein